MRKSDEKITSGCFRGRGKRLAGGFEVGKSPMTRFRRVISNIWVILPPALTTTNFPPAFDMTPAQVATMPSPALSM